MHRFFVFDDSRFGHRVLCLLFDLTPRGAPALSLARQSLSALFSFSTAFIGSPRQEATSIESQCPPTFNQDADVKRDENGLNAVPPPATAKDISRLIHGEDEVVIEDDCSSSSSDEDSRDMKRGLRDVLGGAADEHAHSGSIPRPRIRNAPHDSFEGLLWRLVELSFVRRKDASECFFREETATSHLLSLYLTEVLILSILFPGLVNFSPSRNLFFFGMSSCLGWSRLCRISY